jgi:predicted negative regulator of RcsB-dependent stress response
VGLIPLNIVPVAIIIIIAMFAWEWYSGRRKEQKDESKKGKR